VLLCYVTDRRSLSAFESAEQKELHSFESTERREILLGKIRAAAIAGVDWIQIREKDLSGKDCAALTREALQRAAKFPPAAIASKFPVSAAGAGTAQFSTAAAAAEFSASKIMPARILVNDRLDVAISENAGGVHLGEKSLPIAEAKRLADARAGSRDFLIGVSCHSLQDAESAAAGGADYLFFGPIFATPTKAAFGAPQGLDRLAEVCRAVFVPVLAIGGVTLANSSACLAAGASGIAAIRLFQDAPDLSLVVESLRKSNR
jgi:thiamine-phosphate diphosphorylase